jgi:hypothetical protein
MTLHAEMCTKIALCNLRQAIIAAPAIAMSAQETPEQFRLRFKIRAGAYDPMRRGNYSFDVIERMFRPSSYEFDGLFIAEQ